MSIEIDVLNGRRNPGLWQSRCSWRSGRLTSVARLPWGRFAFAYPEWRVLVRTDPESVGQPRRYPAPRDQHGMGARVRAGGIGGVLDPARTAGAAAVRQCCAPMPAIQPLKDEGATDFALLFANRITRRFNVGRGWKPFDGEIYCDQPEGRIRFQATGASSVYKLSAAPLGGVIDLSGQPWCQESQAALTALGLNDLRRHMARWPGSESAPPADRSRFRRRTGFQPRPT